MKTMGLILVFVGCGAMLGLAVVVITLSQAEHRRTGLLPGPDPRTTDEALLDSVLRGVPIGQVRHGSVAFEDGSGLLFYEPDRASLLELSALTVGHEVVLDKVYELSVGSRFVFRGGDTEAYVDVSAWHLVAPSTVIR